MVQMTVTKETNYEKWKRGALKSDYLVVGMKGAGVLIELEAVFVLKDVCIMEYHCT